MSSNSSTSYFDIAARHPALPFQKDVLGLLLSGRDVNRQMFDNVEGTANFTVQKQWDKTSENGEAQGGGIMSVGRGKILEKCAVNISIVWGPKYPALEKQHADKPYVATGVSLICHPKNPHAPIAHMNVRTLCVGQQDDPDRQMWIGGGADLTPMTPFEEDTKDFHAAMQRSCVGTRFADQGEHFRKWCDEYFYIPHRKEVRGVGGIFFDYLVVQSPEDFKILQLLTSEFANVYQTILQRRVDTPYTEHDVERHLYWRARYAEFNLIYDRGTRFGLLSGGNTEAILCSMPPMVRW